MDDATVWVTWRAVGLHAWPEAPLRRSYLRSPHRHVFHLRLELPVSHDDREHEFHDLQDFLAFAGDAAITLRAVDAVGSCEMIARRIATAAADKFDRQATVDVSEDGESGARVTVRPDA